MILDIIMCYNTLREPELLAIGECIKTADLIPGDFVRLVDFGQTDALYRRKLLSFGLTQDTEISVVRVAPFGCPVQIMLRGTCIALRKHEAKCLVWEKI